MDNKPLGRTGVDIPEIGMGTEEYGGDPAIIRRALELGSFLIDTAEAYRTTEEGLEPCGCASRVHGGARGRRLKVSLTSWAVPPE